MLGRRECGADINSRRKASSTEARFFQVTPREGRSAFSPVTGLTKPQSLHLPNGTGLGAVVRRTQPTLTRCSAVSPPATGVEPEPRPPPELTEALCNLCQSPLIITNKLPDSKLGQTLTLCSPYSTLTNRGCTRAKLTQLRLTLCGSQTVAHQAVPSMGFSR